MAIENGCGLCSVQIQKIGVQKGRDILLEDVSFEMHCGELTALIGVNGAGQNNLAAGYFGRDTAYRHGPLPFPRWEGSLGDHGWLCASISGF